MDNSWFTIPRNINEWQHYQEPSVMVVMVDIVRSLFYKDGYFRGHKIKKGQAFTSSSNIAQNTGLSKSTVNNAIRKLVESNDIEKKPTNHGTLYSINQSSIWFCVPIIGKRTNTQDSTQDSTQLSIESIERLIEERLSKDNRKKKRSTNKFVKPTIEEIAEYCKERSNGIDAKRFFDYYESVGWKSGKNKKPITDWKASVRLWERTECQIHPEYKQEKTKSKWQT